MNKLLNYILSTVIVLTFFSACTQEEVDVFAPGNDDLIAAFQEEVDRRWEDLLYRCNK